MADRAPNRPATARAARRRRPGRPAQEPGGPDVRDRLLEAAGALFAQRGFNEVPIREIARAAGVTPAMIHYYFEDKQGLYDAMLQRALARILERVRTVTAAGGGGSDGIAGLLEVVVGALAAEPWIPPLILREVLSEEGRFRERFIEGYASQIAQLVPALVRREIEAGRFRASLDPKLAFVSLIGMTAFPFVARPVIERVLGLTYDDAFRRRFIDHTRRLFVEGSGARGSST